MSAFLEVAIKGDRRAYIEASDVRRIVTPEMSACDTIGSPERPLTVVFRDGESLEIIGKSAVEVLFWMRQAQELNGKSLSVTFMDGADG